MSDWKAIFETVAGPIAGAATGLAGALLGLKKRMEKVEAQTAKIASLVHGHKLLFTGVEDEFARLREELGEYRTTSESFFINIRNSSQDFAKDAEVASFMLEQQQQWQQFERTLGRIEGHLGLSPQHHPPVPRPQHRPSTQRTPPPFPVYPPNPSPPPRRKP